MSDEVGNLENLNNTELRAKCKEYGLPNVPITDSSRNVLIKKLRASMTGSPATEKAKPNRRETIHASKNIAASTSKEPNATKEEGSHTPSRGAKRRTIVGASVFENEANDRPLVTEVAAPINVRRRSVREQEQQQPLPTQKQKSQKVAGDVRAAIIIESDEEDDDLVKAAVQAEKLTMPTAAGAGRSRTSRSISLSKTGVLTTSYSQEAVVPPRIVEEEHAAASPRISTYVSHVESNATGLYPKLPRNEMLNFMTEPVPTAQRHIPSYTQSSRYTLGTTTTRVTDSIGENPNRYYSPSTRFSSTAANIAASVALRAKSSDLYNEYSDDPETNVVQDFHTPYLSSFTRNLKRLQTDALGHNNVSNVGRYDSEPLRYKQGILGRRPTKPTARMSCVEWFGVWFIKYTRLHPWRVYPVLFVIVFVLLALIVI